MAKKYIIYAGSKDLAECPVTQNEVGKYYRNSAGTYFKPKLAEFDNVAFPAGYKTYIGGSHARHINNPNRNPIDFSLVAGTNITMNTDVNVVGTNGTTEDWIKVTPKGTDYIIVFVHTYQFSKGLVKAGNVICKVAPKSITGYDPHLHIDEWSNRGLKIRDLILNGDFKMSNFKIGDKIKFTGVQHIRSGSGIKNPSGGEYKILRDSVVGEVATIKDGVRIADGYNWYDCVFSNGSTGWVADVGKFEKYEGVVTPPEENGGLIEALEGLKIEVEKQKVEIEQKNQEISTLKQRVIDLEADTAELETLRAERNRLEQEKLALEEKISTLENSKQEGTLEKAIKTIVDFIKNLF